MTDPSDARLHRYCDVAVVGGGPAGLAAALQLGRQRRSVIVLDSGEPRNAPAAHLHGYLGREGTDPARLLADGREEVRRYGGEILRGRVSTVTRDPGGGLEVGLAGGRRIHARRVLLATGILDLLPAVDGLKGQWGRGVIHCPFCHGYEVRDGRIVQLVTHPAGLHPAALFRQLTGRHTVVLDGVEPESGALDALRAAGTTVLTGHARRVVSDAGDQVVALELADGTRLPADAVAVGPRFAARVEAFADLGLRTVEHASGLGDVVAVGDDGATAVAGVYAAGNVTDPAQQVSAAAAHGSRVGAMMAFALATDDLAADRPSAGATDWDHRYGDTQIWSGNPNGSLVAEAVDLPPGRALDVGAGEGGDALWLAAGGWRVTANDISSRVLARLGEQAARRGLDVELLAADANSLGVFPAGAFDLVTASYASLPRTPDSRAVQALLDAVAPGGRLLIVSHDLAPLRAPGHGHDDPPFDPDAYVRVEDFAAALTAEWEIETHETRTRPPGSASASHHVDDVVLRARRRR